MSSVLISTRAIWEMMIERIQESYFRLSGFYPMLFLYLPLKLDPNVKSLWMIPQINRVRWILLLFRMALRLYRGGRSLQIHLLHVHFEVY